MNFGTVDKNALNHQSTYLVELELSIVLYNAMPVIVTQGEFPSFEAVLPLRNWGINLGQLENDH